MKKVLQLLIISSFFFRCSEPEIEQPNLSTPELEPIIMSTDGRAGFNGSYLEFSSPEAFEEMKEFIQSSSKEEIDAWFAQFEFESMMNIYEKAKKTELTHIEQKIEELRSKYTDEEISEMDFSYFESTDYVKENAALFDFYTNGLISDLKIIEPEISYLVNKNGILKVAGHIFQYLPEETKLIVGGDHNKISLLDKTNETNDRMGIVVLPNLTPSTSVARSTYNGFKNFTAFNHKIEATVNFTYRSIPIYGECPDPCDDGLPHLNGRSLKACPPCELPIIGYNYKSKFYVKARYKRRFYPMFTGMPFWIDWTPKEAGIHVDVDGFFTKGICHNSGSTLSYTAYDGPLINIPTDAAWVEFSAVRGSVLGNDDNHMCDNGRAFGLSSPGGGNSYVWRGDFRF